MDDQRTVKVQVRPDQGFATDDGTIVGPGDKLDVSHREAVYLYAHGKVDLLGRIGPDLPELARRWLLATSHYDAEFAALLAAVVKTLALSKEDSPEWAKAAHELERQAALFSSKLSAVTSYGQYIVGAMKIIRRLLWENEEIRRHGEAAFTQMSEGGLSDDE